MLGWVPMTLPDMDPNSLVLCQMLGWGPAALPDMDPDSFILVCKQYPGSCPLEVPESIRISFDHFRMVIDPLTICGTLGRWSPSKSRARSTKVKRPPFASFTLIRQTTSHLNHLMEPQMRHGWSK
jgi:hypothetical protein